MPTATQLCRTVILATKYNISCTGIFEHDPSSFSLYGTLITSEPKFLSMAGRRYFVFGMFSNLGEYMKVYRLFFPSLFLWIFGSSSVWHTQMRVLTESTTDEAARAYASSIQQECNMTGISVCIILPSRSKSPFRLTRRVYYRELLLPKLQ